MNALFSMFGTAVGAMVNGSAQSRAAARAATKPRAAVTPPQGSHDDAPSAIAWTSPDSTAGADAVLRLRIRDRYIGARFPGVAQRSANLEDSGAVIKAARLYFENDQVHRAQELLGVAADLHPEAEALWLARLELAFLLRDAHDYRQTATRFSNRHPASSAWPEVRALARSLGLTEELFRDRNERESTCESYGPWPHLPGWLQASWDLTPEVLAAELRARVLAEESLTESQPSYLKGAA
jgi:hypothetical protein